MEIVPIQAVPSQTLTTVLTQQNTQINVFQKTFGVFIDILLDSQVVVAGVLCENGHLIIRNSYFGYLGDFAFYDTQGTEDPVYTGLGTRFILVYLTPDDIAALPLPQNVS